MVLDAKRRDVEAMPDDSLAVAFVSGAVRISDQEDMLRLLRRKSRLLVACGACAAQGGVPGLANLYDRERIMKAVYEEAPTTPSDGRVRPVTRSWEGARESVLPAFRNRVRSLDQVVDVDYILPGCPPPPKLIGDAVSALVSGHPPPRGAVLAPDVALCDTCPRKASRPENLEITEFHRTHLTVTDPGQCFTARGIVCMGPATRGGCEAACPNGNMPCTGCFGPTSRVRDQGAKMLSSLSSIVKASEPAEIGEVLAGIVDPIGTFYRYGLARSFLRGRIGRKAE
jgi:F420-non-reducing hydrogenase small subunit